ncbi:MAG: LysM peptidoglycan-binding domain-containing protein [Gammaproteobacteria bacterium]|nr:LysM peptidoglycan-binding domain-containing protein [Gammaproteobacteria bacterium]
MKFNHLLKSFFMMMLVLGLVAGCASTPEDGDAVVDQATAEQAIADAKSSNAQAKKMNAEWRDTGKIIESAEAALADGDYAKATELANKAQRQAEAAMKQAKAEEARLKDSAAISGASEDDASSKQGAAMSGDDSYEVVGGDNLWNISAKDNIYSNPYQWPLIYKANRGQIKDADLIHPGQVFDIDRSASGADVDAAVNHAKTRGAWSVGSTEASDEAYLAQ